MIRARDQGEATGILELVDKAGCCILRDREGNARPFLPKEIRGYDGRDRSELYKLGFVPGALVRFDPTGKGAENVVVLNPHPSPEEVAQHAPRPRKFII